jgi:uncharacterized protein YbjT (DUF2867 family)
MNITITGSLGNIGRRLTEQLTAKGHKLTVVSHSSERVQAIEQLGARAAIGSLSHRQHLLRAFDQADAVFTMIPPDPLATDAREYIRSVGEGYAWAIEHTGVRYVVNLSSIGAHSPDGAGPTGANHQVEKRLDQLEGINVLHLRPGMFYTNFYGSIPMIKHQNIIGNNFDAEVSVLLSHPHDIADIASTALDSLSFAGTEVRYVVSDEKNGREMAAILGAAIGSPNLSWVSFSDETMLRALMQNGFTEQMASVYIIEIGAAMRNGTLFEDYRKNGQPVLGRTNFPGFAKEFATVYQHSH